MLREGIRVFRSPDLNVMFVHFTRTVEGALITNHYGFEKPISFHVNLHIFAGRTTQHFYLLALGITASAIGMNEIAKVCAGPSKQWI